MASWLEHPRYIRHREGLVKALQRPKYRFRVLNPVIFLCGAKDSEGRDAIRNYFKKHHPTLNVFYAEKVWDIIAKLGETDALQMEAELAALADLVIVVVESPGTFTELGAFSISPDLRKKLLPIVDKKHEHAKSFIATGPLTWIDKESDFKPAIYAPLDGILDGGKDLENRLARIPKSKRTRLEDLSTSPKHLLFFICDLIAVIYPATLPLIMTYLNQIAPSVAATPIHVPTLVGLAVAMDLLRTMELTTAGKTETYHLPTDLVDASHPFHHSRYLYLEGHRAAYASVLLTFPEGKQLLEEARAKKCS